ncbi:YciI family protein [Polaromonas sp.]|uniref:YciI family protein n=1 Tax=Polaromonas sp. TaxID=1869339 RepID=UPI003266EA82
MKYLCLAYYHPEKFAAMAAADVQALVSQCPAKDAELKKTGQLVVSASLGGPEAAFALRPRSGKTQVTDGPYAEAKELVGGFFIIEAADRDEAVRVASLHPAATLGEAVGWGIEIHPIGFFEMTPGQ